MRDVPVLLPDFYRWLKPEPFPSLPAVFWSPPLLPIFSAPPSLVFFLHPPPFVFFSKSLPLLSSSGRLPLFLVSYWLFPLWSFNSAAFFSSRSFWLPPPFLFLFGLLFPFQPSSSLFFFTFLTGQFLFFYLYSGCLLLGQLLPRSLLLSDPRYFFLLFGKFF